MSNLQTFNRTITSERTQAYLQSVLDENARTATYLANKTLRKVQKKVGFAGGVAFRLFARYSISTCTACHSSIGMMASWVPSARYRGLCPVFLMVFLVM